LLDSKLKPLWDEEPIMEDIPFKITRSSFGAFFHGDDSNSDGGGGATKDDDDD